GVAATAAYTALLTWFILKVVSLVSDLRVDQDEEIEGLDIVLHEERGYDL
ncbi:MAG: ammonia channel protein, partial [Pseudomonadales bacterium]|nr:ammonia channel protein [Pseudomonadales bacterium]